MSKNGLRVIFRLALLATIVMAVSCTKESIAELTPETLTTADLKKGKAVERPVAIRLEGIDNQSGIGGTFTAQMTHLGKVDGTTEPYNIEDNGDGTFLITSVADDVINAANGDKLFSRSLLTFTLVSETSFTYTGTITFVGGTGRFEGATGSMQIDNGVYNIIGENDLGGGRGTSAHDGAGTITY